ncbi:hypothetical protein SAMN04489867_3009 [Pedococcus dokdonensis]|uniref:Uncharacterized protein n=1 Tax=Pedococcus dokdonensis TaxID=443156 RepID=A0A1H0TWE3_9MICO|nr:hypothetical protein SAMN04489867_3009 [Pedococcus dokdonensis]
MSGVKGSRAAYPRAMVDVLQRWDLEAVPSLRDDPSPL